ncbi:MAG TPA: HAD family hydrolase [Gammaproteobacteria bacterium]|nr:HAD family hydrolase [Gammaproteobacteria bacterium]
MAIKGVFFDLGGTLFSYRHVARRHGELLTVTAQRLGLADPKRLKRAYATAMQEITARYADLEYYLHRDLFRDALVRALGLLALPAEDALLDWYLDEHRGAVFGCLELKDDCCETLRALHERGLYQSVVSNIDDDMLDPLVAREGLDRWLQHWTSSEQARSCKPHRRFFEICLEKSGLAAHEVLFVGDSPEHDIAGADALGMQTALIVDPELPPPLQSGRGGVEAHHRITRLRELCALV